MRTLLLAVLVACSAKPKTIEPAAPAAQPEAAAPVVTPEPQPAAVVPAAPERLAADTPKTTTAGNKFVAPLGWSIVVRGSATILAAPEGDSHIALVDVDAKSADEAVKLAWTAYAPDGKRWPLKTSLPAAPREGWTEVQQYQYQVSPNEKRSVSAVALRANGMWTVLIDDMATATREKRLSQAAVVGGQLLPKGYERETFAGKQAHALDQTRLAELGKFIESARQQTGVPGVAVGLVQDGKVVFAGGFGVRELGKPAKVDGNTKFMIASNTKGLTTLMLAKLVDEKKLAWDTPAASLVPEFKLGDAATTSQVLVKHLICACTGMPRRDLEWLFEMDRIKSAEGVLALLGTMQPTSKFGELYQYSNAMAAAAGFIGGRVAFPKLEMGKAYDEAMRTRVFGPLGMTSTTFDYKKGSQGNAAVAHAPDAELKMTRASDAVNRRIHVMRPTGGAWSSVRDMLKFVQMELAEGKLPNGKQYISKEALLARRAPQVATAKDSHYGMGLSTSTRYDVMIVSHGGALPGMYSTMFWLPEHSIGAVVLTNGVQGTAIHAAFRRKLLEVLFDGKPEADAELAASAKLFTERWAAERKLLAIPAAAEDAGKLAPAYTNAQVGDVVVTKSGNATIFDFGEWKSEVATRKNPDGSTSFMTIAPGHLGFELVAGAANGKRSLTLRDAQHEYVLVEK
jgi:CubicO group peptidase (beta-lactamase class C family)